jgi:hypothetical protein
MTAETGVGLVSHLLAERRVLNLLTVVRSIAPTFTLRVDKVVLLEILRDFLSFGS